MTTDDYRQPTTNKRKQSLVPHPDPDLIALGVRQPWAELILRGIKTIEVRSLDTLQRGTIYLYASRKLATMPAAESAVDRYGLDVETLPRGLLVGTVDIVGTRRCTRKDANAACVPVEELRNRFAWQLANPQRFEEPHTVRFLPYGVWFYPFKRRRSDGP